MSTSTTPAWAEPAAPRPSGFHPVSVFHLVAGLVFLGLALTWALEMAGALDADVADVALPLVLLIAGLAGLAATFLRSVGRAGPSPSAGPSPYAERAQEENEWQAGTPGA